MANQQYSNNFKQCSNCTYWAGSRQTNTFGEYVIVDSPMTKGKCLCRGGPWHNTDRQANASCNRFEKWPALK